MTVLVAQEGNGNPLQCSCLENPRDRGVWWAAVSGVAQSRTRLKRLSSSSMSDCLHTGVGSHSRKYHIKRVFKVMLSYTGKFPMMMAK